MVAERGILEQAEGVPDQTAGPEANEDAKNCDEMHG
jgi:hypothetical protein